MNTYKFLFKTATIKNILSKSILFIAGFITVAIFIVSCKDTTLTPSPTNETELITTVKIELTDTLTGQKLNYFFRDLDGEGGNVPSQWDTIKLSDSSFYSVSMKFLNESNPNSVIDITAQIAAEKANHLICFTPILVNALINRTDTDGAFEIGLTSTWKTGAVSDGDVTIALKHQPGIKNGTCDPGETDVEVKFPAKIY